MSNYYSSTEIRKLNCTYNIIIGKRSNGKTYDALYHGLEDYIKTGAQFAIVRRWDEDFAKQRGASMFQSLTNNRYGENVIARLTEGEYNDVYYYSRRWYLCRYDNGLQKRITAEEPFAYGFSLSATEHDKSTSYNKIKTIIFDEFLTRSIYLANEYVLFMNCVSTIARDRDDDRGRGDPDAVYADRRAGRRTGRADLFRRERRPQKEAGNACRSGRSDERR